MLPPGLRFGPLGTNNFKGPPFIGEKPMLYLICVMGTHYTGVGFNRVKDVLRLHGL